tara:strand:+ start:770 stop:1012 length:243 start_codon:yes stop_codon:yes gene_type:complete
MVLFLTALLALVACAPVPTTAPPTITPTPSPEPALEPAPTPAPEEESPEDMQYATNRLYELHNEDMPNFINEYNITTYED